MGKFVPFLCRFCAHFFNFGKNHEHMNIKISLYLDKRRKGQQGKHFVRLRLYDPQSEKTRFVSTNFKFSEYDFERIWKTKQPRNDVKVKRRELEALIDKAEDTASQMETFSFEHFERLWYKTPGEGNNVFYQYDQTIKRLNDADRVGTALNYTYSKKALTDFVEYEKGQKPEALQFKEITPAWLERFERYTRSEKTIIAPDGKTTIKPGKSATTIGIYLRPLRALFNEAIDLNIISRDIYPFGRRRYEIPHKNSVKKALTRDEMRTLYEATPETEEQQKARDYFFFLYGCAGLNIKDLAGLKYGDIHGETIVYIREKTKRTTKANIKPVVIYLNDYTKEFISQYGNPDKAPDNYIFPIYKRGMTAAEKFRESINFTKFINQHIKKLAIKIGLTADISTYWSRHTFATQAIRNGASLEQVSQALNHTDMSTTKAYFAGFEDAAMREITTNLMKF